MDSLFLHPSSLKILFSNCCSPIPFGIDDLQKCGRMPVSIIAPLPILSHTLSWPPSKKLHTCIQLKVCLKEEKEGFEKTKKLLEKNK